jgi:hypothetical protein
MSLLAFQTVSNLTGRNIFFLEAKITIIEGIEGEG